jgi:hypothetical protein|tara:strand:+ start:44 stop:415 length:372 start_codon:yes stop_codon:yes gene_type:complete
MSKLSRAVKRRDISADILKKIEQDLEEVPLSFHEKMTKILLDIPVDRLHKKHEFETVAIIGRCASLSGIWYGELKTVAEHQEMQCNVDKHFKNRWRTVKENPSATVVDFLDILLENKSKLSFV